MNTMFDSRPKVNGARACATPRTALTAGRCDCIASSDHACVDCAKTGTTTKKQESTSLRFGHDFGRIAVGGQQDPSAGATGKAQQDASLPTDATPVPAQAPAVPAATPTLAKRTTLGPTNDGCGGFDWGTIFSIDNATGSTKGFVVQKIVFNLQRDVCAGGTNNFSTTYWEAWEVRGGVVYIGTSAARHDSDGVGDRFRVPATIDHKGSNSLVGVAKFMPNYTAPTTWGSVPAAGSLPATTTAPAGWSDSGGIRRTVSNTFDCCNRSDLGDFNTTG